MICPGKYNSNLWTKHHRPQELLQPELLSLCPKTASQEERDRLVSVRKHCAVSLSLSLSIHLSHMHALRSLVWPVVGVFGTSVSQCGCHSEVTHSLNHTVILFIDVLWQTLEWSSSAWCRSEPQPVCSRSCAAEVILVRGRKVLNIDYSRWSRHADPLLE